MPKYLVVTLALAILFPAVLLAQKQGFLHYGVGFTSDIVYHRSEDPTARPAQSRHVVTEFLYEQYVGKLFSVQGGIRDKYVETRIDFYDVDTTSLRLATNFFTFPLRVKTRIPFWRKFLFSQNIGASLLLSHTYNNIDNRTVAPWQETTLEKKFPKSYLTFDIGAGLHYRLGRSWKVSAEYAYSFSSQTLAVAKMYNTENNANSSIEVMGRFQTFTVGVAYRISNIWRK